MALGASVEIFSNKKFKYLAVEDLFTDYRKTVLNPNDIITSIIIPLPEKKNFIMPGRYLKDMIKIYPRHPLGL